MSMTGPNRSQPPFPTPVTPTRLAPWRTPTITTITITAMTMGIMDMATRMGRADIIMDRSIPATGATPSA